MPNNEDIMLAEVISEEKIFDELKQARDELDEIIQTKDFSKISKYTEKLSENTECLVKSNRLPEKDIVKEISTTSLSMDLAFSNLAKQTAVKLQKLEEFLGKIEDRLFSDETIKGLSSGDLLSLYQTTRIMKTDSFRMLKDIRKDIDFDKLEATLLSLHNQKSLVDSEDDGDVKSILEQLITSPEFIQNITENEKKKINS